MEEGSAFLLLFLFWFAIPVALALMAVGGIVLAGIRRGYPWLIPIPIVLVAAVLRGAAGGPLNPILRYVAVVGIPAGIALIAFLPARADWADASGRWDKLTRVLILFSLVVAIGFSLYLATDPGSCHGGGRC